MSVPNYTWTLRTRWVCRRNMILASPRFQRWAMRLPIIRGIARRKAAAQFDLVAGFVYSQVLLAFVETGLLQRLQGMVLSLDDIVAALGLSSHATRRLLAAGAALDLVEEPQAGLWALGEAGAPLAANTGALAMIAHHPLLYRDLADPVGLFSAERRSDTALSAFWTYAAKTGEGAAGPAHDYSALMAATQPMVAEQALAAYDFGQHRRMLDIGGGSGAFTRAIRAAAPRLDNAIFDLAPVIAGAAATFADDAGVTLHAGSFKQDPLPAGYDLITTVRILHDHDDAVVADLLANIHQALPIGGRLLIIEPMADATAARRMGHAYFGLYLWAMGSGEPRSARRYQAMLKAAGFSRAHLLPTPLPLVASVLVVHR